MNAPESGWLDGRDEPPEDVELARVLDGYIADVEAGRRPDPDRVVAAHPGIAGRLRACLKALREIERAAAAVGNDRHPLGDEPFDLTDGSAPPQGCLRGPGDSVLTSIWSNGAPPPLVLLREPAGEAGPLVMTRSDVMPAAGADRRSRYQLLGEIARGGMGVVLKGRDVDLGRDLAIKVLLERHREDPEFLRRFVEEAQIGGQLQHPGIVPVYELGTFADDRAFFAMKLVQGQTLSTLLRQRPDPSSDLSRYLGIFEHVCQTMAYAHARGVIHRDLKPSNVMVGSFGEVQVMDWGLAKVMARGGTADEATTRHREGPGLRTVRSGTPASDSVAGSAMGTPAYMAPEQARGDVGRIDERADVFGLGAILCEILAGRAPYSGRAHLEIVQQAARGDLAEVTSCLSACDADREIVDLARDCLKAEPEHRPRDASEVTRRMTGYLAGVQERLHAAEVARVEAQAKAGEERKRRKLVMALAAALIGLLGLGGSGAFWLQRQSSAARTRTELALRGSKSCVIRPWPPATIPRWAAAVESARQAEITGSDAEAQARASALRKEVEMKADAVTRDRAMVAALEDARLQVVEGERGGFDQMRPVRAYRSAFHAYGVDVESLPESEVLARLGGSRIVGPIAAVLDDWASRVEREPRDRWRRLADAIDPDPVRRTIRMAMARREIPTLRSLAGRDDLDRLPATTLGHLGAVLKNLGETAAAEAVWRRGQQKYPDDLWLNSDLADLLSTANPPRPEEAIRFATAALAVRPGSATIHYQVGRILTHKGQLDGAMAEFRRAIELRPNYAEAHNNLGSVLATRGNMDEAFDEFREAVYLKPSLAMARRNLGNMLQDRGNLEGGAAELREAIKLDPGAAGPHFSLGLCLRRQGKTAESIAEIEESLRLEPDLPEAHNTLGNILNEQGRAEAAIAEFRLALRARPGFAAAHSNLGNALLHQGKTAESIAEYQEALRLDPGDAVAHANLGNALRDAGNFQGAIAEQRKALELRPGYASDHNNLGVLLILDERPEEAIAEFREASRLDGGNRDARDNLGRALVRVGRYSEALEVLQRDQSGLLAKPGRTAGLIATAETMMSLEKRLPAILSGQAKPVDVEETIAIAKLARLKELYSASTRFWADALRIDPSLGVDRKTQLRRDAAYTAALAGCGCGKDDPPPDDAARKRLREQALGWLRAELSAWKMVALTAEPGNRPLVARTLTRWKADADLTGVRDPSALEKLPEDEREAWRHFWAEVDALLLLKKAGA